MVTAVPSAFDLDRVGGRELLDRRSGHVELAAGSVAVEVDDVGTALQGRVGDVHRRALRAVDIDARLSRLIDQGGLAQDIDGAVRRCRLDVDAVVGVARDNHVLHGDSAVWLLDVDAVVEVLYGQRLERERGRSVEPVRAIGRTGPVEDRAGSRGAHDGQVVGNDVAPGFAALGGVGTIHEIDGVAHVRHQQRLLEREEGRSRRASIVVGPRGSSRDCRDVDHVGKRDHSAASGEAQGALAQGGSVRNRDLQDQGGITAAGLLPNC